MSFPTKSTWCDTNGEYDMGVQGEKRAFELKNKDNVMQPHGVCGLHMIMEQCITK